MDDNKGRERNSRWVSKRRRMSMSEDICYFGQVVAMTVATAAVLIIIIVGPAWLAPL
jgi:hypothetical protein